MKEVHTLLAIENFMKTIQKRSYRFRTFAKDFAHLLRDAKQLDLEDREYAPLIQAYLDLIPEYECTKRDSVFNCRDEFEKFCTLLEKQQHDYICQFRKNNRDRIPKLHRYFKRILSKYQRLLLVRVDLAYKAEYQPNIMQFEADINRLINRVQNKDTIFRCQIGYAYRLEQGGKSSGYHCHLLVIYEGRERYKDEYLGNRIGELWKKITNNEGKYFNCNQKKHKQDHIDRGTLGIGMVRHDDHKTVINTLRTISYLALPEKNDQYLRGKIIGMRQFNKGQLNHERKSILEKILDIHHLNEQ